MPAILGINSLEEALVLLIVVVVVIVFIGWVLGFLRRP